MEYILTVLIIIVIYFILGQPALPLILFVFWGIVIIALLFFLFFAIALLAFCFTKKVSASFLEIKRDGIGIPYAFYEIEGKTYRNIFPTDQIWEGRLYSQKSVKVRIHRGKKKTVVWDRVTGFIIVLGLFSFGWIAYFVFYLIQMV